VAVIPGIAAAVRTAQLYFNHGCRSLSNGGVGGSSRSRNGEVNALF